MTWRITLGDTTLTGDPWGWENISGWLDGVGVDLRSVRRIGHGVYSEPPEFQARVMALTGWVSVDDCGTQQELRNRLTGLMPRGDDVPLTVEHGGLTLTCMVHLADRPTVDPIGHGFLWELAVASDLPWLYAPEQRAAVGAVDSSIGLVYPLFSPAGVLDYGGGEPVADGSTTNRGNADAWPTYWLRGDMPAGFRLTDRGHVIEWNGPIRPGSLLAVDSSRNAVEIWGTDVSQFLSRDDFQPVRPGESTSVKFEPLGGGSGICEVRLASTYI